MIAEAYANAAPVAPSPIGSLIPIILIFFIFYFLLIRPQQRRLKEHKDMVDNLQKGDFVVTSGGIIGKISKISDKDEIDLEIASGVLIKIVKSTISQKYNGKVSFSSNDLVKPTNKKAKK